MTIAKTLYKEEKIILGNYENHPQYLKYERLLDQYLEINNDEEKQQKKFNEITEHYQKLVQTRILDN